MRALKNSVGDVMSRLGLVGFFMVLSMVFLYANPGVLSIVIAMICFLILPVSLFPSLTSAMGECVSESIVFTQRASPPKPAFSKVERLLIDEKYSECIVCYEELLVSHPDHPQLWLRLIETAMFYQKHHQQAISYHIRAMSRLQCEADLKRVTNMFCIHAERIFPEGDALEKLRSDAKRRLNRRLRYLHSIRGRVQHAAG